MRLNPAGVSLLTEPNRNWTGAPGSPKRTWAGNDRFRYAFAVRFPKKLWWASPGFPVDLVGVGEPHAAFLTESRTCEPVWRRVQEIRVARLIRPTYAEANVGHPSSSYWVLLLRSDGGEASFFLSLYLSPGGGALTLAPLLGGCQPSLDGPFWKNTESLLYGPVAYIALAWPNNFPARSVSARTLSTNW